MSNITVRHSNAGDGPALTRLAALDSAGPPLGPMLLAESGDRLLAAVPLDGAGRAIADPFARTADLVALLELRARQLRVAQTPRPGLLRRLAPALADR
jgi:hypothetical protein